jgi:hypothetical protein
MFTGDGVRSTQTECQQAAWAHLPAILSPRFKTQITGVKLMSDVDALKLMSESDVGLGFQSLAPVVRANVALHVPVPQVCCCSTQGTRCHVAALKNHDLARQAFI